MRIIYLHQYFNTPEMSGGTRSYEMARRFVAQGHEVHMITSDRTPTSIRESWRTEDIDGIQVHWFPVQYNNKMSFMRRVRSFFEFAIASSRRASNIDADIIFATSTPLTIAIPAVIAKLRLRIPMVFEVRDLWPEMPVAVGALKNPIAIKVATLLEHWAYFSSEHVIALSPGMADGIISTGYPQEKVSVIPNSSDLELFSVPDTAGAEFRSQRPWLGDRPLIVYAGTFGLVNDVEYLVSVASEARDLAPDLAFLAVGEGATYDSVSARAAELGVLDVNFYMEGSVPKREIPALMNAATISTSLFKPIKAMEANSANKFFDTLAAGRPVAINYGGWQADLIRHEGIGLVLSRAPKQAAQEIVELVRDRQRLLENQRRSRKVAAASFSRDELAEGLLEILCRVQRQTRAGRGLGPNGR